MVTNEFARDRRLSLAARGLGLWLLSHVDGWEITATELAKAEKIGRDKLRGYLGELEAAGYLVRERARLSNGRLGGMDYQIFCTPQEQESPRPDLRLAPQGLADKAPASGPHKKTTSKKTTQEQKTNPSGGGTADAAPRSLEDSPIHEERPEDAVAPPAESLALFDVPAPTKAQKAESPSAKTVVAAYVDSYRHSHPGAQPPKSSIGRVARDAKALLSAADADPGELSAAATQMGEGQWDNLTMALKIYRERGSRRGTRGALPALPHTHPVWQEIALEEDARDYQRVLVDDDLVRWISGDPSEVDKWITRYPELAARFESVA